MDKDEKILKLAEALSKADETGDLINFRFDVVYWTKIAKVAYEELIKEEVNGS